jgi:hypothetical protein
MNKGRSQITVSIFIPKEAGVDVMITIYCDFCQFSAKKLASFSKANVMMKFFHNLAFASSPNRQFLPNFSAKIFLKP